MARVYACLRGPRILAAAVVLILCATVLLASDDVQKTQKKDLEQAAKAAIAEAKQLESSGKLVEARFKYAESLGYLPEKDAEHSIKHLDDELKKSAKEKIEAAQKLYESARYQDAAQTLEDALLLETFKPLIYYNLALCHFQLKNGSLAAEYLDRARASAFTPKMRARLAEMRTIFTTAESPASAANLRKQAEQFNHLAELVGNGATLEDDLGDEEDDDPAAPNPAPAPLPQLARSAVSSNTAQNLHAGKGTRFASACEQLQPLKPVYAASAAFAYDSAGCAEDNNRPDEAAALLGKYLELSPNALDRSRTSQRIADLQQLRDLSDSSAAEVRRLYAAASRAAEERKYDRTLADYKKAAALVPDLPLTHWRLALLLESMGDVRPARAEYQRFLELSKDEELRQRASFHLELLDEKKQKYDDEVSEAAEIFAYLFNRAMNLTFNSGLEDRSALCAKRDRPKHRGEDKSAKYKLGGFYTVPFEYGQQQVAEAAGHLITATSIFPLGPEANELMALVYLQALDGRSALRAFDAVASRNIPVSFYGELRGHNIDRPVKCELSADHIRFIFLAQNYDKKGFAKPPSRPAHEDGLADLVILPDASRPMNFEDVVYRLSDVKRIETRGVLIAIRLQHEDYSLAPLFVTAMPPTEGPPARRFTNDYVRLFMRYPGLEDSKLGAEGLSGGEKFKIGMNIANAAMNISMGGAGMFAAVQDVMTIRATALMLQRSFASTHIKFAAWEQSVSDQQDLLIGNPFKPIPLDPLRLTYAQDFK